MPVLNEDRGHGPLLPFRRWVMNTTAPKESQSHTIVSIAYFYMER